MSLFERLGNRFPKDPFGAGHVALAKRLFTRWGVWAVFFGRFIALLRILAGPLAGRAEDALSAHSWQPMPAAACCGPEQTAAVYYAGLAAERWLSRFSWIALVVAVLVGIGMTLLLRERTSRLIAELEDEHDWESLKRH